MRGNPNIIEVTRPYRWKPGETTNLSRRSEFFRKARRKAELYTEDTIDILSEIILDKYNEASTDRIMAAGLLLKVAGMIVSPTAREEANELASVMNRETMEQLAQLIKDKCTPEAQKELLRAMGADQTGEILEPQTG